jgi:XTP/dITP diphosphohydrolase
VRKLVIASRNKGKVREIAEILSGLPFEVVSIADYPNAPEVEETGSTFEENAVLKAKAGAQQTGELTLADDSGLVVDALNGAPGIYSSRFAGEGASDRDLWCKLLGLMYDIPDEKRTARFVCAVAIASPEGKVLTCEGKCEGVIAHEPRGEGGFGYDPVFLVSEYNQTMAELPAETKNKISHRAGALECAKGLLGEF